MDHSHLLICVNEHQEIAANIIQLAGGVGDKLFTALVIIFLRW